MTNQPPSTKRNRGVTLIELLIALVISGIVVAGIYRIFVAQAKTYTVQDQVAEVQQSTRSAMEIMVRDLRMAGYDDDNLSSPIQIANPIVTPLSNNSITVNCEYYDTTTAQYQLRTVFYTVNVNKELHRQETITPFGGAAIQTDEIILNNVDALNFSYGVDYDASGNEDGAADYWGDAASAAGRKVIAIRITLTARPTPGNPDVDTMVAPRTLVSTVTLRNLCLIKLSPS